MRVDEVLSGLSEHGGGWVTFQRYLPGSRPELTPPQRRGLHVRPTRWAAPAAATDTFPINGTDFVEFYVGNAKQASHYYRSAFGFQLVGYRGPGDRRARPGQLPAAAGQGPPRAHHAVQPGRTRSPTHVHAHGDGVRDIALWVDDAREAFARGRRAGRHGRRRSRRCCRTTTARSCIAAIQTYGDTIHTSSSGGTTGGSSARVPAGRAALPRRRRSGLQYVDHCVGNVELGEMNEWVEFYERRAGLRNLISFDDKDISTEYSALMSKVVANGNGRIKFPDQRAGRRARRSRRSTSTSSSTAGPGVQHIAHRHRRHHRDGHRAARPRRRVPPRADDLLRRRCWTASGKIDEDLAPLAGARHPGRPRRRGYLLQIFTKPVEDRPTLFYEIIQRKGAKSFGKGTSRRCSRRSSGSRRRGGICREEMRLMPIYHTLGQIPRKRHIAFRKPGRRALRRGADGARGVHRDLVAALSHPSARPP